MTKLQLLTKTYTGVEQQQKWNVMVLTRLLTPRVFPSSLCPDLSSFLLPAGRKHSIWIGFGTKNQSLKLNRNDSSEEHNWFTDRMGQKNPSVPRELRG